MPLIANWIAKIVWLESFNESVIELKKIFNDKSTNIPTSWELLSWALDTKNTIVDWVNTTKEKIDWFRETMSWVEDTYNSIKDWYDDVKDFIEENEWKLDAIKWTIENIEEIRDWLTNTWKINQ